MPAVPAEASRFSSDDVDEVRERVGEAQAPHARVVQARGAYGFELTTWIDRGAWQGIGRSALAVAIRATFPMTTVQLGLDDGIGFVHGRRTTRVGPGTAVLIPRGTECTVFHPAGTRFAFVLAVEWLERELTSRAASDRNLPLRPHVLRAGPAWRAEMLSALASASPGPVAAGAVGAAAGPHRMIDLLADVLQPRASTRRPAGIAAHRLASLEDWIDAHLHEPLTLGRLCEQAGVGDRALQLTFAARRGLSPMRFVTERRLALAHRRLRDAAPEVSVTQVAYDVGFAHLGRFTSDYRRLFGELPSQTLRQQAAWGPARAANDPASASHGSRRSA